MHDIINNIFNLFFPTKCLSCGKIIAHNMFLCKNCKVIRNTPHLKNNFTVMGICAYSPLVYTATAKKAMLTLKQKHNTHIACFFAHEIYNMIKQENINTPDIVVAVPQNKKNMRKRGHNNVALIAKYLAKKLEIRYSDKILIRCNSSLVQHNLDLHERKINAQNSYMANNTKMVNGMDIILLDDIITTGATAKKCESLLYYMGAKNVIIIAGCVV